MASQWPFTREAEFVARVYIPLPRISEVEGPDVSSVGALMTIRLRILGGLKQCSLVLRY
jgi:hypothetical protein